MSRKDFELIAEAFRNTRPVNDAYDPEMWEQWKMDVNNIALALRHTNPRFDRTIFIAACNRETN